MARPKKATVTAKGEATKSTPKKLDEKGKAIRELFNMTLKTVESSLKRPMWRLEEIDKKFGIPGYLSTGLPSLDMSLMHNSERTEYGFPYGRVVEVCGDSGSCKTTLMNLLSAKNLAKGGISYYISTEFDFDISFFNRFLVDEGLTPLGEGGETEYNFAVSPVTTIKELFLSVKGIVEPIKALADELTKQGKTPLEELPPILIVCDSLGALMGDENRNRIEEDWDKGDKTGGHAKELHDFFKFFLYDFARLGIMFVFTNHYRADMSMSRKTKQPAHDPATKYYCSLRTMFDRRWDSNLNKSVSRMGRSFEVGFPIDVSIYKIRGDFVLDGTVRLNYYHNHGFDYISSLVDSCKMASVFVERKGIVEVALPEDAEGLSELEGKRFSGMKELKEFLSSNLESALALERLSFRRGPDVLEDLRGK
jgi:RecA/RadA recombinase